MINSIYSIGVQVKFLQCSLVDEHIWWYIVQITVIQLQFAYIFFLSSQACGTLPPWTTHFRLHWKYNSSSLSSSTPFQHIFLARSQMFHCKLPRISHKHKIINKNFFKIKNDVALPFICQEWSINSIYYNIECEISKRQCDMSKRILSRPAFSFTQFANSLLISSICIANKQTKQ